MQLTEVAVGVVKHGLFPLLPEDTPQEVLDIVEPCFAYDPKQRPSAEMVMAMLMALEA
jgi:hypothetical protein